MRSLYDEFKADPKRRRLLMEEDLFLAAAEQICQILSDKNINRTEFARLMGRSKGYITQVLSGKNLTLRTLVGMAAAVDAEVVISFKRTSPQGPS